MVPWCLVISFGRRTRARLAGPTHVPGVFSIDVSVFMVGQSFLSAGDRYAAAYGRRRRTLTI